MLCLSLPLILLKAALALPPFGHADFRCCRDDCHTPPPSPYAESQIFYVDTPPLSRATLYVLLPLDAALPPLRYMIARAADILHAAPPAALHAAAMRLPPCRARTLLPMPLHFAAAYAARARRCLRLPLRYDADCRAIR